MATEFRLPELGENVEAGDVLKILIAVGDTVSQDQAVLELETDKATIEVPSPVSGTVKTVHVKEGEKLKVGGLILTVEEGAATNAIRKDQAEAERKAQAAEKVLAEEAAPSSGKAGEPVTSPKAEREPEHVIPTTLSSPVAVAETRPEPRTEAQPATPHVAAPATPSVRRLARELGVDINDVPGSGPRGRISDEDVRTYVKTRLTRPSPTQPGAISTVAALPDFSKWGEIERQPMRSVRRKTAEHLSHAWATIPHVTHYDKADITELEPLRVKHGAKVEAAGGKLTMSAIAVKVVASALKVFPEFATSVDLAREEIIYKKYVHIGVAVDTDRGLLVPVIRDVDKKNILDVSVELAQLAERARSRKITLEEMAGGVFTISNLGGIGGTHFSPIVNSPEVAILGIARARMEPVFLAGMFQPRLMLPLSLSYDHRMIDGAHAARFLRWVVEALEQPFLLSLEG